MKKFLMSILIGIRLFENDDRQFLLRFSKQIVSFKEMKGVLDDEEKVRCEKREVKRSVWRRPMLLILLKV